MHWKMQCKISHACRGLPIVQYLSVDAVAKYELSVFTCGMYD